MESVPRAKNCQCFQRFLLQIPACDGALTCRAAIRCGAARRSRDVGRSRGLGMADINGLGHMPRFCELARVLAILAQ